MRIFTLLLVMLSIAGCTYSPSGTNFLEVSKEIDPIQAFINVSPVSQNADTFIVSSYVQIDFNFEVGHKEIRRTQIWLANDTVTDTLINTTNLRESLTHELNTFSYPDGVYRLNFGLLTSSGTNSIADRLRVETTLYEGFWFLKIDNAPSSGATVVSTKPKNGR